MWIMSTWPAMSSFWIDANMKTFNVRANIGKARYVVNYHDGVKLHRDNSPFFDVHICSSKRDLAKFTRGLIRAGYVES